MHLIRRALIQSYFRHSKHLRDTLRNLRPNTSPIVPDHHGPAEFVNLFHFLAARPRFIRAASSARRKLAGRDRRDQETEQSDPVLFHPDRELKNRRQKEKVVAQYR